MSSLFGRAPAVQGFDVGIIRDSLRCGRISKVLQRDTVFSGKQQVWPNKVLVTRIIPCACPPFFIDSMEEAYLGNLFHQPHSDNQECCRRGGVLECSVEGPGNKHVTGVSEVTVLSGRQETFRWL